MSLAFIAQHARDAGNTIAVVAGARERTYAQFFADIGAAADALRNCRSDARRAVVSLDSGYDHWTALLGAQAAGFAAIGVAAAGAKQAAAAVGADVIVTYADARTAARAGAQRAAILRRVKSPTVPAPAGVRYFGRTAGTTALQRTLALTAEQCDRRVGNMADHYRRHGASRYLSVTSPYVLSGYVKTLSVWQLGGTVIFPSGNGWAADLLAHKPDEMFVPPHFLAELLASLPDDFPRLPDLRIRVGGARLSQALHAATVARITPRIERSFGTGETDAVAFCDIEPDAPWREEFIVAPWATVEIVGADGRPAAPGVEGALRMRTNGMAAGYLGDDDLTHRRFRDGWFLSGDRAACDANGRLTLGGRDGDELNIGGIKLMPADVEDGLRALSGITDAAVFAAPNDAGEHELWVATVAAPGATAREQVHAFHLAHFGSVARVHHLEVRALPRNEAGKVMRRELEEMARRARGKRT